MEFSQSFVIGGADARAFAPLGEDAPPFEPGPTTGRSSGGFICGVGRLMVRVLVFFAVLGI